MKKYLYSALALPLLFACSSEDITEQEVISNDQFAGIEKVDATFSMAEGFTRFDGGGNDENVTWNPQEGDLWGFAWLTDAYTGNGDVKVAITGNAFQNHNLIQTDGIFKPQTSIYVGKYYIYRPYDKTTVSPQAINFKSLEEQPLAEGMASTGQAWKNLAKTAINIGDKWTEVTPNGWADVDGNTWDNAGTEGHYKLYAAMFSNQTGLDLTYVKNNPTFAAATAISGATDINLTYAAGEPVGAADIYKVTVDLDGSAKSFTYAPTASPNGAAHSGTYWADKSNLGAGQGFTFTDDVITLKAADQTNGLSTGDNGSKGWFWFNSLPVTAGTGALGTAVQTVLTTSYGNVTVNSTVGACAYAFEQPDGAAATAPKEWIKFAAATDQTKTPKEWDIAVHNTFVNQYGNHKGKFALNVDFSTGVMNNMHIQSDAHLQKLLKYYIASGKADAATLLLDKDADNEFKISKISIALIQTIQAAGHNVKVKACDADATHTPGKIVVTQAGQTGDLANATEVPALNNVFAAATDVYLSKDCDWTWSGNYGVNDNGTDPLPVDANVTSIINEGTATTKLTVYAKNIELSVAGKTLKNAAGATMNITQVTTVKTALTNLGTINVGKADNTAAELRAYAVDITNEATALNACGVINNHGVVGVTAGTTPAGTFNNYGDINMMSDAAITLLTTNATGADAFGAAWADANKMGTVNLPANNPTALVSVSNSTNTGFIKYIWPAATTTYATPAGNVKYNTIVVSNDITFTAAEEEIKYIEFNGTRTQVVNPLTANKLTQLKGIIVNAGKSIIIEMNNVIDVSVGAHLGTGATIYKGGKFRKGGADFTTAGQTTNYLGPWSLDQVVEY